MPLHSRPNPLVASALLLLSMISASGCASWHSIGKEPPAEFIARKSPDAVRISVGDSMLIMNRPSIHGDRVVGFSGAVRPGPVLAVPTDQIKKVEVQSRSGSLAGKVVVGTFWATGIGMLVGLALFHHPHTNP